MVTLLATPHNLETDFFSRTKKKGFNQKWLKPFFYISGGADGTRIRPLLNLPNADTASFSS